MLLAGALPALALLVWLAVHLPAASARTDPHDARATWTYLQAEDAFFHAFLANSHRGIEAADDLVDRLAGECPGVASSAPSQATPASRHAETELLGETVDSVLLAAIGPDLPAYGNVATRLARLSWSSRSLTVRVHRVARNAAAISVLRPPDLCGDLREWATGGYIAVPATAGRFLAQFAATQRSFISGEGVERMLARYEGPRGRALRRHLERLANRVGRAIDPGLGSALRKAYARLGFTAAGPPVAQATEITIPPPASVVESGGRRLSEFYEGRTATAQSGCLACHRIGGVGNAGPGPDLTHIGSKLTGTRIARALIDAKAPMPSFRKLPKKKFEAVVEFLSVLR